MNKVINLLNENGYYLYGNSEKSIDGNLNSVSYVLRDNDEIILHEILICDVTTVEEVSRMIDIAKRQRTFLRREKN